MTTPHNERIAQIRHEEIHGREQDGEINFFTRTNGREFYDWHEKAVTSLGELQSYFNDAKDHMDAYDYLEVVRAIDTAKDFAEEWRANLSRARDCARLLNIMFPPNLPDDEDGETDTEDAS